MMTKYAYLIRVHKEEDEEYQFCQKNYQQYDEELLEKQIKTFRNVSGKTKK